jgi:hypothetical protein
MDKINCGNHRPGGEADQIATGMGKSVFYRADGPGKGIVPELACLMSLPP